MILFSSSGIRVRTTLLFLPLKHLQFIGTVWLIKVYYKHYVLNGNLFPPSGIIVEALQIDLLSSFFQFGINYLSKLNVQKYTYRVSGLHLYP